MLFNKRWVDEWVPNNLSAQELADKITMAGLEVDSVKAPCGDFAHVVIAKVLTCVPHPDSDHMHLTTVDDGSGEPIQVVCGAHNCREGLKVCFAQLGAPVGDLKIKKAKLRGVESNGMLCSYKELGMAEESDGIIELPEDAPLGMDIHEYFHLDDSIIDVDLTTNRPDCLGIYGIAREASVLIGQEFVEKDVPAVLSEISDTMPVKLLDKEACPRYLSRIIRGVNQKAQSPLWMTERLRRCGIRAVSPIVDVTNYVMLEYSQPLHSFDLNKLHDEIIVRKAHKDEPLTVLSGEEIKLSDNTLIIADSQGPVAIAGIFGGANSGIDENTTDVVLESAFFAPDAIKGRARQYGLDTDASHRFERGVDHEGQRRAMERATELLLHIAGGKAGPIHEEVASECLPKHEPIVLRMSHLKKVLGIETPVEQVEFILTHLGMKPKAIEGGFEAISPSFRFDIAIEEDLIEEVARMYGYDNIPNAVPVSTLDMVHDTEETVCDRLIKESLVSLGYNEAITYSFTDPSVLKVFSDVKPLMLTMPISPELSAMRTSLVAGLVLACRYNLNRQQKRVRLFEQGLRYIIDEKAENGVSQEAMIAAVAVGAVADESWNQASRNVDFFDIKGDLENLLGITCKGSEFEFRRSTNKALHPGQSADIYKNGELVGYVGMLHPQAQKELGIKQAVAVFEIKREAVALRKVPAYESISKFPTVRRDLAFVVDKKVEASALCNTIREVGGALVKQVVIFDVFEGESLGADKRSIALGVLASDTERTLEDQDTDALIEKIVAACSEKFGATLRS